MLCSRYTFNGKSCFETHSKHCSLCYRALDSFHVLATSNRDSQIERKRRLSIFRDGKSIPRETLDYICPVPNKNSDDKRVTVLIRRVPRDVFIFRIIDWASYMFQCDTDKSVCHGKSVPIINMLKNHRIIF